MAASTSDKITATRNGARPNSARVTTARSSGGTSLTCDNLAGWPTASKVHFVTYKIDTNNDPIAGSQMDCSGIVSGSSIGSLTVIDGTDNGHAIGDVVEMLPTAAWGQDLYTALTAQHSQVDGSHTNITATGLTVTGTVQFNGTNAGWTGANETWTYSSYDSTNKTGVITVPTDATTKYSAGMRVMFTNNSATQYGIITKVAATALTVYFGTDYSLTNSAITSPFYSLQKAPFGFPLDPSKWTVAVTDTSDRTTTSTTPSNVGSVSISVPIGAWFLEHMGNGQTGRGTTTFANGFVTLSASSTTEDDKAMTSYLQVQGASGTLQLNTPFSRRKLVNVTSATSYFQNIWSSASSITTGVMGSTGGTTTIRAICAYL